MMGFRVWIKGARVWSKRLSPFHGPLGRGEIPRPARPNGYQMWPTQGQPPGGARLLVLAGLRGAAIGSAGLLLALAGCSGGSGEAPKAASKPGVPVTVATVESRTLPVRLAAVGNGEAVRSVAVKARVDGQIDRAFFTEGQEVKAGDLLFQLDPRPLQALLAQAEAKLAGDRAQLAQAQSKERRYLDLQARNFVSGEFYAQVRTDLEAAQANLRADQAAVDNARVQLEYTTIRSPVAGRTGKILIQPGNLVKANDTNALVVINQLTPIYVSFTVPEQHLTDLRQGLAQGPLAVRAQVPQDGGDPAMGHLAFIDNAVDAGTGTVRLKAVFDNRDKGLWPGQFLNVTLTLREQPDALVVPATAVQAGPRGQYVFVVDGEKKVALREVVVDRVDDAQAVIAQGLTVGEVVVASGQLRLTPGATVVVQSGGPGT